MHIEYEISERGYLSAQHLAIRNHPRRSVRWTRVGLPVFGVVLLVGYVLNFVLVFVVLKQTLSWGYLFGLLIPAFFISTPLLNKRSLRNLYARSTSLHGKLCLSADEGGIELEGSSFQSKVDWSVFDSFFEDKDSFVLFQKTQVINIVPKRALNPDDIRELNKLFQMKIKRS